MTSAGGLIPVADGARAAASLLLSGPAGGVRAAAEVAAACGFADAVSFDMGGTSTDVCLVRGGVPEPTAGARRRGLPDPAARARRAHDRRGWWIDRARSTRAARSSSVRGARARCPGPRVTAAAARSPTVTDADLVLGRIPADAAFPDLGRLDVARPRARARAGGRRRRGRRAVVDAAMERAVRVVTVERGVDPRELALVAFGGAGPLHACAIADALGMRAVIVPPRAGVCSAVGLAVRAEGARGRAQLRAADRSPTRSPRVAARGPRAASAPTRASRPRSTVATSGRATSSRSRRRRLSRPSTSGATATSRPGAPVEVDRGAGARVDRRAAAHHRSARRSTGRAVVGPAVVAEPDCTVWVPDGLARRAARARRVGRASGQ